MEAEPYDSSKPLAVLTELAGTVLRSVWLLIGVTGLLFVLIGYVLQTGVMAALLPIWGVGLMVCGFTAYVIIWWTRK